MNQATISADVISYTSLTENERLKLSMVIKQLLEELSGRYSSIGLYCRLVKGDLIECAMNSPRMSLRVALLLKTFIKTFNFGTKEKTATRLKYFSMYGIRAVVAIAPLNRIDPVEGIIDGEAIFISGRTINNFSTSDKQKIFIKNSLCFVSSQIELQNKFDTVFSLIDVIISKCSAKQSEVLYYKLLDYSEKEIAKLLNKAQSTISQHSTAAGWTAIEKALLYFENNIE
jgi:hypothetical protein